MLVVSLRDWVRDGETGSLYTNDTGWRSRHCSYSTNDARIDFLRAEHGDTVVRHIADVEPCRKPRDSGRS